MQLLASHLAGAWSQGSGSRTPLVNPATEELLAEVPSGGHDLAAAFTYARKAGAAELARLNFAERGALIGALAKAIHGPRGASRCRPETRSTRRAPHSATA
jgi:3,4-dehydroadipyl-CoA semialdehyde dehydrogenase